MNDTLELGSVLPFLELARKHDLGVIILNPNFNNDPKTKHIIPYSHSMSEHTKYVWQRYIDKSEFSSLFLVAHSAGGRCL